MELLKQNADALELVREASRRPYARFDLDFTEGFALLLPHISSMRDAVRLLEAVLRWLDGDMDGAAENIETMLAVAEHLQAEKTLLAQLAGIAMVAITLESLGWLLERDAFSPMILERLDSSLRWHETNPRILVGMVGEVAFANAIFTTPPFEMLGEDWEGGITGDGQWLTFLYALSGRVHWDHSFYLEAMRERLEHMREPHEKWSTYSDTASEMEIDEKRYLFSGLLLPNGTNLFRVEVHTVARLRIARILLALERHRSETGSLPETFDPLAPRFLPEVPMDPVPGRPFTVKRESDFLIIESFGRMRQGPDREERPIAGRLPVVREVE